jgi:hypothetical protein
MNEFIELIDTYLLNYSNYDNGKVMFECNYGELCFNKQKSNTITIYAIYIHTKYRQHGLCRDILRYLIDKSGDKFEILCVESVLSKVLYEYLLRFTYKNKRFKNKKNGFVCRL